MKGKKTFTVVELTIVIVILGALAAVAVPRFVALNKSSEANLCQTNQALVESAIAVAYAESLKLGHARFPARITEAMFEDGIIPTCPYDGDTIAYDTTTGTAYCPNGIESHARP